MRNWIWLVVVAAAVLVLAAVWMRDDAAAPAQEGAEAAGGPPAPAVGLIDDERIKNADSEPGAWLAHGRTYEEQRFSPLTGINRGNVADLGLAWHRDMGTNRALEATPIVVDGAMYFTSTWSRVYAVDAVTGEDLWSYDPQVPGEWARWACCDVVNRGVAVYQGRVYFASLDGRLIALDAATGALVWEVDTIIDRSLHYTITGAPRAARGKVFIGNGGAEYGVRGYVTAYDAATGEQLWRFYTVPGDPSLPFEHPEMEMAAKTWKGGEWWKFGGGGTVWNSIVYDPDFEQVYLGVGNGSPWTRVIRSPGGGDNLFLSSIVALDADTGAMNWFYQTTPGDNWDYTAVQDMALAEMEVDGQVRKVLLQAPKNGFFYVLDRADGELLRAHPYAAVTWATHVDLATGRPVENPDKDYVENPQWVLPGPFGGHNWQAMAVDVEAGLAYVPAHDIPFFFEMAQEWQDTGVYKQNPNTWNLGIKFAELSQLLADNLDSSPPTLGYLKAFDPLTGEEKWTVEHPHYWNGGVVATAGGLVFQGDALGMFTAYDKDNGAVLWQFNAQSSMLAPPVTYAIDGVQYVAVLTGSGGGFLHSGETVPAPISLVQGNLGRLLVFKLGGAETLPPPKVVDRSIPEQELPPASAEQLARGERLYNDYCSMCHGLFARSGGAITDLRLIGEERHAVFSEVVLQGLYASKGMASFADTLVEDDVALIQTYVRHRAGEDRATALGKQPQARLTWIAQPPTDQPTPSENQP